MQCSVVRIRQGGLSACPRVEGVGGVLVTLSHLVAMLLELIGGGHW